MKLGSTLSIHTHTHTHTFFFKVQGNITRAHQEMRFFYPAYFIVAVYFFIITIMIRTLNACNWG